MNTMRKIFIMAIFALVFVANAMAQGYPGHRPGQYGEGYYRSGMRYDRFGIDGLYLGLRIGPSFTTVDSDDKALDGGSSQTGLNVGFMAGLQLSPKAPVYLESGLMYVEKGGKNVYDGKKITYGLHYLEIPIVVKYAISIDDHFSIQPLLGGYLAFGVGGKAKNFVDREAASSFSKRFFKRFDGGLRLGCGVSYDLFYADLTYDIGLANICHDEFETSHNRCLALNFGVNF